MKGSHARQSKEKLQSKQRPIAADSEVHAVEDLNRLCTLLSEALLKHGRLSAIRNPCVSSPFLITWQRELG
jgi:hypothetical protein